MNPGHDPPRRKPGGLLSLALAPAAEAIDPVCGMTVDPATASASLVHDGHTYYFCNPSCRTKFQANPARYLSGAKEAMEEAPPPAPGTEYVCPMDPEVVSDRPGPCPKCGMALEPRTVTAEEGPNPELADMSRRLWVGLALGLPVFLLAMADMLPGRPLGSLDRGVLNWLQLALTTPVVLW